MAGKTKFILFGKFYGETLIPQQSKLSWKLQQHNQQLHLKIPSILLLLEFRMEELQLGIRWEAPAVRGEKN